jgi:predicted Zn-dependent peptidase
MVTPKAVVNMNWFTESIPYTLENYIKVQTTCEVLNLLYNQIVREENSATYGCYADYFLTRGEKDEYQIGFSADCEMQPEKCDSVLTLMKKTFFSLAENIDETIFKNAKESLLKSLDELEKTKNGFWLDIIWKKEDRGMDFYTNRRKLLKQLTPNEILEFVKKFLKTSHFSETLMQPSSK